MRLFRVATLCLLTVFGFAGSLTAERAKRPNIVFFFIDDMGWTDVSFMGSQYYESPNIDRLAAQGMVFTSAYANGPNCAPSRASLMSGQYTPRHGIFTVGDPVRGKHRYRKIEPTTNKTVLDDQFITIAEALKTNGYVTATMGKWHLGDDPTTQGFDVNIAGRNWGSPSGGGYHSPYRYPNLVTEQPGEYLTDRLGQEACKFIRENKVQPFFLYLTHYAVHTPIQGKKELIEKYRAKTPSEHHNNPTYAAMVESVDDSVAAVLGTLDEFGLTDNTIVLFFSDNGGHMGATSNYPLRGAKGMLYEGGIREPMIVKWPGVTQAGSICDEPVIGIDVYPTLLEMTGTARPADYTLDGLSLTPLLKNLSRNQAEPVPRPSGNEAANGHGIGSKSPEAELDRDAIFWHFPCYLPGSGGRDPDRPFRTTPAGAVRMGDWKLIEYFEDGGLELFNLRDDIGEQNNLVDERPDKVAELQKVMYEWRKQVDAPIPTTPNPMYDPNAKWKQGGQKKRGKKK